jgi:hypothetical protein
MAEEDILYGKHRHLFGGIAPSNMKEFTVAKQSSSPYVYIWGTLPSDTIIDGQTLCSVAGVTVRRRTDNYPIDEFDGEEVCTYTGTPGFSKPDTTADVNGTYYYAAFPFSTQGVYNRNVTNRAVYNEPASMVSFTATSTYVEELDTCMVVLDAELPLGVAGAIIRRSTTGYPVDENDGEEVTDITVSEAFTDSNVDIGVTYYYSAFPYTSTGAYNRSTSNRAMVLVKKYKYLFGYDLVTTNSNTSNVNGRVSYPSDVDNANYSPAYMDFDAGTFNYGDWPSTPGEHFMPKPCVINAKGVVQHYLDPDNYSLQEDGVTASKITTKTLYSMMEWPKIYTHREIVDGVYNSDSPMFL